MTRKKKLVAAPAPRLVQLNVKVQPVLLARIDRLKERVGVPIGMDATRADVLRELILAGLKRYEGDPS